MAPGLLKRLPIQAFPPGPLCLWKQVREQDFDRVEREAQQYEPLRRSGRKDAISNDRSKKIARIALPEPGDAGGIASRHLAALQDLFQESEGLRLKITAADIHLGTIDQGVEL